MNISEAITFDAGLLAQLPEALRREWLVTNGIGGYASATVPGANTRHYHGLLVAALDAPLGRAVLLSKLDEMIEVRYKDGIAERYELGVNLYPGAVHPEGYQWLAEWSSLPAPTWTYRIAPELQLEKRIWMAHGANVTYISYRLISAPADCVVKLQLCPLLAWRDYHSEMAACAEMPQVQWTDGEVDGKPTSALHVALPTIARVTSAPTPLELRIQTWQADHIADIDYAPRSEWYYRFQHPREAERGLESSEDLFQPGIMSFPLTPDETVVVTASAGQPTTDTPETSWQALTVRQEMLVTRFNANAVFARQLALAADAFVVQPSGSRTTVIAGYHWFGDWGRDTMIALPGLCLATGRATEASEILRSFADYVDGGMLPNRFPDAGAAPEYNTVDAALWYFVAIWRYVRSTGDLGLLRGGLWGVLQEIIRRHRDGTRYNIHVDGADSLLYAGQQGVQLTWMDARVGDQVVTPRIGKPVEINSLWHNALQTMADFADRLGDEAAKETYLQQADRAAHSFTTRFVRPDRRGLYDVLDTPQGGPDSAIRPNQVFAVSLPFAPLAASTDVARGVVDLVRAELLTPVGLRTLAASDPAYRSRYEGGPAERDGAYHQGTVWPWLLGPYAEAYDRVTGDREGARALLTALRTQLAVYGVGSLAEVYDGDEPQRPNGSIAQAWSVAETLRVFVELTDASTVTRGTSP